MAAKHKSVGLSKVNKPLEKIEIIIDSNIVGKDIVLARIETDNGSLDRIVYSRSEHEFSLLDVYRKLNPKKYIKIILIKKVGISNIEPKI